MISSDWKQRSLMMNTMLEVPDSEECSCLCTSTDDTVNCNSCFMLNLWVQEIRHGNRLTESNEKN